jgi:hypothetical protein
MTQRNHTTDVGASLDMGTYRIASPDIAGSTARMRIGKAGQPALIELSSASPPASPAAFSWEVADGVGLLRPDLSQQILAALGGTKGTWEYVVHIIAASGQVVPVDGAWGSITLRAVPL